MQKDGRNKLAEGNASHQLTKIWAMIGEQIATERREKVGQKENKSPILFVIEGAFFVSFTGKRKKTRKRGGNDEKEKKKEGTMVQNNQESRRNYWATRSFVHSFACALLAHSHTLELVDGMLGKQAVLKTRPDTRHKLRLVCVLFTFENNTGWTDGRTYRRIDGTTDGRTDGHDLL